MRYAKTKILAGVAATVAAISAVSAAARPQVHVLNVALPDGSVEQVRYTGDHPPQLLVRAEPVAVDPFLLTAFGADSPFAMVDRIAAMMDMQADAMLRQAQMVASQPMPQAGGLQATALAGAPAGAQSFTLVSTANGSGVCTQSVSITSLGEGKAPQVVRKVSGDCGAAAAAAPAAAAVTPTVAAQPAKPGPIPHDSI